MARKNIRTIQVDQTKEDLCRPADPNEAQKAEGPTRPPPPFMSPASGTNETDGF